MSAAWAVPLLVTAIILSGIAEEWWADRDLSQLRTSLYTALVVLFVVWACFVAGRATQPTYFFHVVGPASEHTTLRDTDRASLVDPARRGISFGCRSDIPTTQPVGAKGHAGFFASSTGDAVLTRQSNTGAKAPHAADRLFLPFRRA
jgi:hypothetical protein